MHRPFVQSWDAVTPQELAAATCVVARRRGVMHVFNNAPLTPFALAHRPFRANVCACVRTCRVWPPMARESEPSVLLFHVAPIGGWSRRLISDTPTVDDLHYFLLHLLCFPSLLPSSPITPRLLSAPLLLAPTGGSAASALFAPFKVKTLFLFIYFIIFVFWNLKGKDFLGKGHNLG